MSIHQVIQIGDRQVSLPEGVTVTEWALEKVRWQNPRIRAFLGSLRLLGTVLESNYAILHCSPERLLEIWRKVRTVAELIRVEIAPLLVVPSRIPELERARRNNHGALQLLTQEVLSKLGSYAEKVPPEGLVEVRKLLCVSIGQMHAFLQDAFGELMAADPRSSHDADYFLSRRFPQDIEEAEWLHLTVERLRNYLDELEPGRVEHLDELGKTLAREQEVPRAETWEAARGFLNKLHEELTPKLKEVLALRGVRFEEMEILDRYTVDIPGNCGRLITLQGAAQEAAERIEGAEGRSRGERERAARDLAACHTVFSRRMLQVMAEIDAAMLDLRTFVPLWLDGIERRRALLLRRSGEEPDGDAGEPVHLQTRPIQTAGGGEGSNATG